MDDRIVDHADVLVSHSAAVEPGDVVVVVTSAEVDDLATAVCSKLGEVGATPVLLSGGNFLTGDDRHLAAYLAAAGDYTVPDSLVDLLERSDAVLHLQGYDNPAEFNALSDSTTAAHREAYGPALEAALFSTRYTLTQVPTPGGAQLAELSTEAFADFLYDATLRDWDEQRRRQAPLVDRLNEGSTVRVVSGETTDVSFAVEGMRAVNDYGKVNLPGGEVYTAPVVDSVAGTITFDLPLLLDGREFEGIRLELAGGEVEAVAADGHEDLLGQLLALDEGASRVGEFGVGLNADLDHVTRNMALDEKMDRTVHFALGSAYPACVAAGNTRNESAIHLDLLVDMREDSVVEVDDEVVLRDGDLLLD